MSLLKNRIVIFFIVLIALISLWWGVPSYQQARADALVRELCVKDGRLTVYEAVKLPASRFGNGVVRFPGTGGLPAPERSKKPEDTFYYRIEKTWIVPEESFKPAVWRVHAKLFRNADAKLLGEGISYARVGGDPIGPWHPSSFGCPDKADITDLVRRVFVPE